MIDPHIFAFPLSLIFALVLALGLFILRKSAVARIFTSTAFTAALFAVASVLVAVEGIWAPGLFHHWTFLAVVLLVIISLGFTVISDFNRRSFSALFSHLGLFLALAGGFFGACDTTDASIRTFKDREEHLACSAAGGTVPLPFSISLKEFKTEYYSDGVSPKQFSSLISADGRELTTAVNHPARHRGYNIYQSGYDAEYGQYSVLKLVREPWIPVLVIGAVLLALGAFLALKETWSSWKIPVAALVLAAVFALISVARINFGTLMPALRSIWFIPHLIVYMLAYSILAIAAVTGIISLFTSRIPSGLPRRLLSTASSLLLVGMLCGAVWARQAWGDWWTWDAKECWAAVTWLLTLAGTHSRPGRRHLLVLFTVLSFLAMQVTWYGVNYLPSSDRSLHTYNQQ